MSSIIFCQECNNILYPKEDKENRMLLYSCRHCDHQQETSNHRVFVNDMRNYEADAGIDYKLLCSDPTLPRIYNSTCPGFVKGVKCRGSEAVFLMSRNIHRDTPLTLEYVCCECFTSWK